MSSTPMASEDADRSPFEACAHCGTPFKPDKRYPALTRVGPDESLELYSFCDEECKAAWQAEQDS